MFLLIASVILCICAFFDGYTTVEGIKSGKLVEGDKFLDFIYGTDLPKPWQTYGIGFGIIGLEILLAWLLGHFGSFPSWVCPSGLIGQGAFHIYAAIDNERLIKEK
jgi:hypothetical protein